MKITSDDGTGTGWSDAEPDSSRYIIDASINCRVGYSDTPLPVELISFTAMNRDGTIILSLETATEENNYGFQVQRKKIKVKIIGKIWDLCKEMERPIHQGITNLRITNCPDVYKVNYRLKQIDNDVTFVYSKTITVNLTTITSAEDEEIPTVYFLSQNYPNPFNPNTTIKFAIPSNVKSETSNTKLIVYDVLGRDVATLVNQKLQPGFHEVNFDASNLPSGIYVYKIEFGKQFSSIKKMLLLK